MRRWLLLVAIAGAAAAASCDKPATPAAAPAPDAGADPQVTTLGTVEVTARLEDVPAGAIVKKDLYNYVTVLKYRVLTVHRGTVQGDVIYVGHYNPFKPRAQAADRWVKDIGGTVREFKAGAVHRMALAEPLDEQVKEGVINKYASEAPPTIYFALRANDASQ